MGEKGCTHSWEGRRAQQTPPVFHHTNGLTTRSTLSANGEEEKKREAVIVCIKIKINSSVMVCNTAPQYSHDGISGISAAAF